MEVEMIARQKNIRRALRINLDRLYSTHTQRIIVTEVTIRVVFEKVTQQLTIGRTNKENERPSSDQTDYSTLKAFAMDHK